MQTIHDFPSMLAAIEKAAKDDAYHCNSGFREWEDENQCYNWVIGIGKKHAKKRNYHGDAYGWYIGQFILAVVRTDPTPEPIDDPDYTPQMPMVNAYREITG